MTTIQDRLRKYEGTAHLRMSRHSPLEQMVIEAADSIDALEKALRPFADIGVGTDPNYQPTIRMDRDAILAARAALGEGE